MLWVLPRSSHLIGYVGNYLSLPRAHHKLEPFDITEIKAPDGSITAKFVSLGATLTELWVRDRDGNARDIVLGYDNNVSTASPGTLRLSSTGCIDYAFDGPQPSSLQCNRWEVRQPNQER